jgi:hypothetical protein
VGLDPFPPRCLSLTSLFPTFFSLSCLVACRRSYLCYLPTTRDPVFQLNEESLTGQSGPVNLASKMPPKEKTHEKGKRKTPEKGESKSKKNSRQESPKGKEATTIRDEPEVNLFLGCPNSINKPLTVEFDREQQFNDQIKMVSNLRVT